MTTELRDRQLVGLRTSSMRSYGHMTIDYKDKSWVTSRQSEKEASNL